MSYFYCLCQGRKIEREQEKFIEMDSQIERKIYTADRYKEGGIDGYK